MVALLIGQCWLSCFYTKKPFNAWVSTGKASGVGEHLFSFAMTFSASNHPQGSSRIGLNFSFTRASYYSENYVLLAISTLYWSGMWSYWLTLSLLVNMVFYLLKKKKLLIILGVYKSTLRMLMIKVFVCVNHKCLIYINFKFSLLMVH